MKLAPPLLTIKVCPVLAFCFGISIDHAVGPEQVGEEMSECSKQVIMPINKATKIKYQAGQIIYVFFFLNGKIRYKDVWNNIALTSIYCRSGGGARRFSIERN